MNVTANKDLPDEGAMTTTKSVQEPQAALIPTSPKVLE